MDAPLVVPVLVLAVVLLVSGAAKVSDRLATSDMFVALRVPLVPPGPGAVVLPWAEIVLGLALLLTRGPVLVVVTVLTALVFAAYWLVVARAMTFDPPVSCSCFGKLGGHRVDGFTLARNTLLVGLSFVALASATQGMDAISGLAAFTSTDAIWLLAVVASVVLTWLIVRTSTEDDGPVPVDVEDLEYDRRPIPYGIVEDAQGQSWTLLELARTKAQLIVSLNPGCGSCQRIAGRLDDLTHRFAGVLDVHAMYASRMDELPALGHRKDTALFQPERNVTRVLNMRGAPSAVLLGADGHLAGGPVSGEGPVDDMFLALLEQIDLARLDNNADGVERR